MKTPISVFVLSWIFVFNFLWMTPVLGSSIHSSPVKESNVFNFEKLVSLIQHKNVKSIEELLPLLPEDLRSRYTLIYLSSSAQSASTLLPRVVLFEKDASFVMTFNSDQYRHGFARLEIIQFRESPARFEFRDLNFSNLDLNRNEPNPSICLSCHLRNPRPIWSSFPSFPGVYGSEYGKSDPEEYSNLKSFVEGASQYPRYKTLNGLNQLTIEMLSQRNADFGYKLSLLNFRRMVDEMKAAPHFHAYKYVTLAALKACADLNSFFPEDILALHEKGASAMPFSHLITSTQIRAGNGRTPQQAFWDTQPDIIYAVSGLRLIFEPRLGLSAKWSMSMDASSYRFANGHKGIFDLIPPLIRGVPGLDASKSCQQLRALSLRELTKHKDEILSSPTFYF